MTNSREYNQIFVKDIENGMIIGRDILGKDGQILLAEGFKVSEEFTIRRLLSQHDVLFVSILNEVKRVLIKDEISTGMDSFAVDDKESEALIKTINDFQENKVELEKAFASFVKGEKVEKQEIQNKIQNTLKVFKGNLNIFQLMQSVKHLDDITYSHCHNVALVSYSIGKWLGLKEDDLQELALSGMLIDIGKMQIDERLLNKTEKLTNDEFSDLKKHCIFSHEIVKSYDFISERVKSAVLLHHEKMDGSGYPLGLKGNKIPLFARIIAIADVYNALISDRPYREKRTPFEAIRILETEYMDKLDTEILYLFLNRVASNYVGQGVLLSDGSKGNIVFIPKLNLFNPIIKLHGTGQVMDLGGAQNKYITVVDFVG